MRPSGPITLLKRSQNSSTGACWSARPLHASSGWAGLALRATLRSTEQDRHRRTTSWTSNSSTPTTTTTRRRTRSPADGDEGVKRYVRWVNEGKRRHIVFGGTMIAPHQRAEPDVQPDRAAGRVPRTPEGTAGAQPRRRPATRSPGCRALRRARGRSPRSTASTRSAHRHDRRAERRAVHPLPDARRLRRGPHARQRADGLQGVPRVQPVARGGLGLQRTRTVCTRRPTSRCSIPTSPPTSSSSS